MMRFVLFAITTRYDWPSHRVWFVNLRKGIKNGIRSGFGVKDSYFTVISSIRLPW